MAVIYGNKEHFGTQAVLAAAEYGAKKLTVKDEAAPVDKVFYNVRPSLVDKERVLVDTNPIAWWAADGKLRGQNKQDEYDVLCWMNAAATLYRPAVLAWVLPATSNMAFEKKAFETAKSDAELLLSKLNEILLTKTFLVGERLSLADLVLAFTVKPAYEHVLEPGTTNFKYQNLTRWFMTVMNQPEVKKVATLSLCEKAAEHDAAKFKQNQSKLQKASTSQKADAKKGGGDAKKDKKEKKDEPADDGMDATEVALAQEEKQKDPFAEMPKGTFNMDEFKRVYSNEDTEKKAIPYFWEKFDKENYSIWHCKYMYPEDLTLIFMSCNLITGMFQRLDKMRKHAFGSMILFGENNKSQIEGIWFWRGDKLAFELSSDWQVDYASYKWEKLDADDAKTKKMVNEYLLWEGDFDGQKFNQGKIFK